MRYGFYLPTRGPTATREGILALAREGERLGLHSAMIADHIVLPVESQSTYPYTLDGKHPSLGDALETFSILGGSRLPVDHWRVGNTDLAREVVVLCPIVGAGNRMPEFAVAIDPPDRVAGFGVFRIEGIDHIAGGRDDDDGAFAEFRYFEVRYDQRLGIDLPIDATREQLSEIVDIDIGLVEKGLIQVGSDNAHCCIGWSVHQCPSPPSLRRTVSQCHWPLTARRPHPARSFAAARQGSCRHPPYRRAGTRRRDRARCCDIHRGPFQPSRGSRLGLGEARGFQCCSARSATNAGRH